MATVTATEVHTKTAGETVVVSISYIPKLDSGELLTGTPTVTVSPSGPTVSSVAKNTAALTISGAAVAINEAVQCLVAGGTADTTYTLTAKCNTTGGGVAREVQCTLKVE